MELAYLISAVVVNCVISILGIAAFYAFIKKIDVSLIDAFFIALLSIILIFGGLRLYFAISYDSLALTRFTAGQCQYLGDDIPDTGCAVNAKTIFIFD